MPKKYKYNITHIILILLCTLFRTECNAYRDYSPPVNQQSLQPTDYTSVIGLKDTTYELMPTISPDIRAFDKFTVNVYPTELIFKAIEEGWRITTLQYFEVTEFIDRPINIRDNYKISNLQPCTSYNVTADIESTAISTIKPPYTHSDLIKTTYDQPKTDVLSAIPFIDSIFLIWNSTYKKCIGSYTLSVSSESGQYVFEGLTDYEKNVTNLKACITYDVTLSTINTFGETTEVDSTQLQTAYVNPSKVMNIQVNHITATSVSISWDKPKEGATCVDYYIIKLFEVKDVKEIETVYNCSAELTSYMISYLNACSLYKLYITTNENAQEDDMVIFSSDMETPTAVKNLAVKLLHSTNVTLMWDPPDKFGNCVGGYKIYWKHQTEYDTTEETTYTITDLKPCVAYQIIVCVLDKNNDEGPCAGPLEVTMESDSPSQIEHPKATFTDNGVTIVHWLAPQYASECIDLYRYEVYVGGKNVVGGTTAEEQVVIFNLTTCEQYEMQVIPQTKKPEDGLINVFNFETAAIKPIAPSAPLAISKTKSSFRLTSEYIDENNKCRLYYGKFICREYDANIGFVKNQTFEIDVPIIATVNSFLGTIYDLIPYTDYKCAAQVLNVAGWSPESSEYIHRTLEDYPQYPSSVNVMALTSNSFQITWTTPTFPNGIIEKYWLQVTRMGAKYKIPAHCTIQIPDKNATIVVNATPLSFVYINADPFTEYYIQIAAENGIGLGEYSTPEAVITLPATSESVKQFANQVAGPFQTPLYNSSVTLSWLVPCETNGIISGFEGTFTGHRPNTEDHIFHWSLPVNGNPDDYYTYSEYKLNPEVNYTVTVSVKIESCETNSLPAYTYFESPAGIPESHELHQWGYAETESTPNPTRNAEIKFNPSIFISKMGQIQYVSLLVSEKGCQEDPVPSFGYINSKIEWPKVLRWSQIQGMDCVKQYQTTDIRWNPVGPIWSNGTTSFVIGGAKCDKNDDSTAYCNGPLKPDTAYSVMIRLFTKSGYTDSELINFFTDSEIQTTVIVMCISSILLLSFMIGIVFLRNKKLKGDIENNYQDKNQATCIPVKSYTGYYNQFKDNHFATLIKEFSSINDYSSGGNTNLTQTAAKLNDIKNRYTNIYPFDNNRVLLTIKDEVDSDYINASFIDGYKRKKEYIATQGPKPESCNDFWNMVLQCKCDKIIMLTQLTEGDKLKCHKYYPCINEELIFDSITIKNVKETNLDIYQRRELIIIKNHPTKRQYKKTVIQYHFKKWPDHDCPQNAMDLIKFVHTIKHEKKSSSPIVVHCSAGVGRTGTLIALDILMQKMKDEKVVNVYEVVKKLRQQRVKMVQTFEQYKFIYKCIDEIIAMKESKKRRGNKAKKHRKASDNIECDLQTVTTLKNGPTIPADIESAM